MCASSGLLRERWKIRPEPTCYVNGQFNVSQSVRLSREFSASHVYASLSLIAPKMCLFIMKCTTARRFLCATGTNMEGK